MHKATSHNATIFIKKMKGMGASVDANGVITYKSLVLKHERDFFSTEPSAPGPMVNINLDGPTYMLSSWFLDAAIADPNNKVVIVAGGLYFIAMGCVLSLRNGQIMEPWMLHMMGKVMSIGISEFDVLSVAASKPGDWLLECTGKTSMSSVRVQLARAHVDEMLSWYDCVTRANNIKPCTLFVDSQPGIGEALQMNRSDFITAMIDMGYENHL